MSITTSGRVCFWTVSDSTDYIKLCQGLSRCGLSPPSPRTPTRALQAALQKLYAKPDTMIRPLDDGVGYAVVEEHKGRATNGYSVIVTATVDESGIVSTTPNGPTTALVQQATNEQRKYVDARAITPLITKTISGWHGILLRDTGGIWFLPDRPCVNFEGLREAVESAGPNYLHGMTSKATPETVRAVMATLAAEIQATTAAMIEEIHAGVGERALENRRAAVVTLRDKITTYQTMLGQPLDALNQLCSDVDAVIAVAAIDVAAAA